MKKEEQTPYLQHIPMGRIMPLVQGDTEIASRMAALVEVHNVRRMWELGTFLLHELLWYLDATQEEQERTVAVERGTIMHAASAEQRATYEARATEIISEWTASIQERQQDPSEMSPQERVTAEEFHWMEVLFATIFEAAVTPLAWQDLTAPERAVFEAWECAYAGAETQDTQTSGFRVGGAAHLPYGANPVRLFFRFLALIVRNRCEPPAWFTAHRTNMQPGTRAWSKPQASPKHAHNVH